jgi:multisubunit Na+/H+ antiporter MnhF subunit
MIDVYILDLLVIGLVLLIITLGSGSISRLPLSFAMIYLMVGFFRTLWYRVDSIT